MKDNPTITHIRGTPMPNPRYFGFKWPELQKLLDEGARLREEAKKAGREWEQTGEEIKRLEGELHEQRAAALRGGPEPDERPLAKLEGRREAAHTRLRDYSRASEMVEEDIRRLVAERRQEWDAEVRAKGETLLAEAQQIADALAAKLSETDALVGAHTWLTNGYYTPATPASITVAHILDARRRELGLLDVGVIS